MHTNSYSAVCRCCQGILPAECLSRGFGQRMSGAPTERLTVCAAFEKGILQDSASHRGLPA